jgi:serine/threonine protein kinase
VIDGQLGHGTFGTVFSAWNEVAGRQEAMKMIFKGNIHSIGAIEAVSDEVKFLSKLKHDNIPELFSFMNIANFLVVSMNCTGPNNLFRVMRSAGGRLASQPTQSLATEVAEALAHCHERGVAHCDLKPENIAITQDGLHGQLVDFGSAVEIGQTSQGYRGTMPFMAPEIMSGAAYNPAPSDVWSLGVLILEMVLGLGNVNKLMHWGLQAQASREIGQQLTEFFERPGAHNHCLDTVSEQMCCSSQIILILKGMLVPSPPNRWTIAQVTSSAWISAGRRKDGHECRSLDA